MNLQFDHLVHTVYDPNAVRQHFADAFGWRTVPGGKHIEWGTYNGLSYFGLSYIEWVGVFDEALAKTSEFGKWVLADLQRGEGVKQFALRTRRMDEIAAAWRARGLNAVGPVQGLRQREDGTTLRWRLLFPARTDVEAFPLPFLIEWEQDDRQREAGLVVAGALPAASAERLHLVKVESRVRDVRQFAERWNTWYADEGAEMSLFSDGGTAVVRGLGPELVFHTAQDGDSAEWIAQHGERPFRVTVAEPTHAADAVPSEGELSTIAAQTLHGLNVVIVHA
jgi:Glyoxalase-like domain